MSEIIKNPDHLSIAENAIQEWKKNRDDYLHNKIELFKNVPEIVTHRFWSTRNIDSFSKMLSYYKIASYWEDISIKHYQFSKSDDERGIYDFWDRECANIQDHIKKVLFGDSRGAPLDELMGFLRDTKVSSNYDENLIKSLIDNNDFSRHGILSEFFAFQIFVKYNLHSNRPFVIEKDDNSMQNERDRLSDFLVPCLVKAVKNDQFDSVKKTLGYLASSKSIDIAVKVFGSSELSNEELEKYIVSFINAFDYISFVEKFAPYSKHDEKKKEVFESFSGEEVAEVMKDLDEVYFHSVSDFITHYENSVTDTEVFLVLNLLKKMGIAES